MSEHIHLAIKDPTLRRRIAKVLRHAQYRVVDGDLVAGPIDLSIQESGGTGAQSPNATTLLIDPTPTPDRRLAGLRRGAEDVLSADTPDPFLMARIRSILRQRGDLPAAALPATTLQRIQRSHPRSAVLRPTVHDIAPTPHTLSSGDLFRTAQDWDVLLLPVGQAPDRFQPDFIADLRSRNATRHVPIIALANAGFPHAGRALDLGADDVLPETATPDERALRIRRVWARHQVAVHHRARLAEGWALAITDALTGLPNRRAGLAQLARVAQHSARRGTDFAVLLMDFDHFKRINDSHGHLTGDHVLIAAAARLSGCLRPCDMIARIGGEEFLVILPETGFNAAHNMAETLRRSINDTPLPVPRQPKGIAATVSFGMAMGGVGTTHLDSLLESADRALYAAKAAGRNRVRAADRRRAA